MDEYHLFDDDTMLNGIAVLCTGGALNITITSGVGNRGEWQGRVSCHQNADQLSYLRAFDLQVEENVSNIFRAYVPYHVTKTGENVVVKACVMDTYGHLVMPFRLLLVVSNKSHYLPQNISVGNYAPHPNSLSERVMC